MSHTVCQKPPNHDIPQHQNTAQHQNTCQSALPRHISRMAIMHALNNMLPMMTTNCMGMAYMVCGDYNILFKAPGPISQCLERHRHHSRIVRHFLMQVPVQLLPHNLHDTSALLTTPSKSHHNTASTGDISTIRLQDRLLWCGSKILCTSNKPALLKIALRIKDTCSTKHGVSKEVPCVRDCPR